MSDSDDDVLCWLLLDRNVCLKKRRKRSWMHRFNEDRFSGEFLAICQSLRNFPHKFKDNYSMSIETFDYILEGLRDDINGQIILKHYK